MFPWLSGSSIWDGVRVGGRHTVNVAVTSSHTHLPIILGEHLGQFWKWGGIRGCHNGSGRWYHWPLESTGQGSSVPAVPGQLCTVRKHPTQMPTARHCGVQSHGPAHLATCSSRGSPAAQGSMPTALMGRQPFLCLSSEWSPTGSLG